MFLFLKSKMTMTNIPNDNRNQSGRPLFRLISVNVETCMRSTLKSSSSTDSVPPPLHCSRPPTQSVKGDFGGVWVERLCHRPPAAWLKPRSGTPSEAEEDGVADYAFITTPVFTVIWMKPSDKIVAFTQHLSRSTSRFCSLHTAFVSFLTFYLRRLAVPLIGLTF